MAKKKNTKKNTGKKKSTNTTIKKKNNSVKKSSTTKKKASTKVSTNTKKTSTQKNKVSAVKVVESEVKNQDLTLPKYKIKTKEVSKNKNIPSKVVESEEFSKKEEKKTTSSKNTNKKYNDKKIAKSKKNSLRKKLNKYIRKIRMYGLTSVVDKKYIVGAISVLAFIIIVPILFALFGGKSKLDLSVVPEKIDQLNVVSFNADDVASIISSSNQFDSLKSYYEYDFKEMFNLETYYVSDYSINYNKSKKQVFIAIKPNNDYYDNVKSGIDKFLKENKINDYKFFDYQGYLIYIKSKDSNDIVASKVRQANKRVFNILKELKKDEIEKTYGISGSYYSEALVKIAMVVKSDTCEYAIFKPVNDNAKHKIKNAMDEYYKGLESKWSNNEENLKLVQGRYFEEYQGYLIYIVSHDNDMVMELIKKS